MSTVEQNTASPSEKSNRGRKPIPVETRRVGRYLRCPCCELSFYYDPKLPQFKSDGKGRAEVKEREDKVCKLP